MSDGQPVNTRMPQQRPCVDVEDESQPRQPRRERVLQRLHALMSWARLAARIRPLRNGTRRVRACSLRRGCGCGNATIVDATILDAPASTTNGTRSRDPERQQVKKGNHRCFETKTQIGVDATAGLVHGVATTAANMGDITQVTRLLHGGEKRV